MRAWIAVLALLAVAGLVLALAGGDTLDVIGVALVGIAAVGAVSLGFFAVGRSEDRAREAEARGREPGAADEGKRRADGPGDGRLTARRPPRSRGDS
jgi:hypothetical protein